MAEQTEQPFVKASQDEADPVGSIGSDWGFWDETWSHWHGGFADETAARAGLSAYADTL